MRIGCLQFAPQLGDVDNNLNRADSVLSRGKTEGLDILILPELAFSGRNFKSLNDIEPFLEYPGSGITSLWARTVALKYDCTVVVGYPEKFQNASALDKSTSLPPNYNSALVINEEGETVANYRKRFLASTDETWAREGQDNFLNRPIPKLGMVLMGISSDMELIAPSAPQHAFEFATCILRAQPNLLIVLLAEMTKDDPRHFSRTPNKPDMETLEHWVIRLESVIRSENQSEIIVVFCNRTGYEDDATYAGTSAVLGIHGGEVKVYGLLGRSEKDLLVVDTDKPAPRKLVYDPQNSQGSLGQVDQTADAGSDAESSKSGSLRLTMHSAEITSRNSTPSDQQDVGKESK
ncbi:carbon-nitrogen family protein [Fusarium austroafricanum]|uniref:Carbon-nitrogen family protein n=1 Tax=Fusarium austroafricanum TaxID=2364996 RepID=A0A8H4KPX2_9HYPO|nr:carbon-nitrogen family protein [Fusarium austroafricanum]